MNVLKRPRWVVEAARSSPANASATREPTETQQRTEAGPGADVRARAVLNSGDRPEAVAAVAALHRVLSRLEGSWCRILGKQRVRLAFVDGKLVLDEVGGSQRTLWNGGEAAGVAMDIGVPWQQAPLPSKWEVSAREIVFIDQTDLYNPVTGRRLRRVQTRVLRLTHQRGLNIEIRNEYRRSSRRLRVITVPCDLPCPRTEISRYRRPAGAAGS